MEIKCACGKIDCNKKIELDMKSLYLYEEHVSENDISLDASSCSQLIAELNAMAERNGWKLPDQHVKEILNKCILAIQKQYNSEKGAGNQLKAKYWEGSLNALKQLDRIFKSGTYPFHAIKRGSFVGFCTNELGNAEVNIIRDDWDICSEPDKFQHEYENDYILGLLKSFRIELKTDKEEAGILDKYACILTSYMNGKLAKTIANKGGLE